MSLQTIVNGLLLGGLYAAVGVGFSLVWGVMNVINLAHGAMIMLGAYTTYWVSRLYGIDPFLTVPLSMTLMFILGYLLQEHIINFVVKSGVFMTLILTHGMNIFLVNVAYILWKGDYRSISPAYAGQGLEVGGVIIPYVRLIIVVVALLLAFLLHLFLTYTKTGNAIRATALNKEAAQLVGINIGQIYAITFAIGSAMAGAAGSLMSSVLVVTPVIGNPFIGKAFAIACLGGLGTMLGAIVGGLVLGLAETVGAALIGPSFQHAISFIALVLILIIRPEGIMGKKFFAEVK
jgi:branched-chain amino acid transport system permease protein